MLHLNDFSNTDDLSCLTRRIHGAFTSARLWALRRAYEMYNGKIPFLPRQFLILFFYTHPHPVH